MKSHASLGALAQPGKPVESKTFKAKKEKEAKKVEDEKKETEAKLLGLFERP